MSGHLPLAIIILAGIVALCWADLGRKRVDADNEADDFPEVDTRPEQRFRQFEGG